MYTLLNELFARDIPFTTSNGDTAIETDKAFILSVELPGVKKEAITMDIDGSYLTVKAEKKAPFDKTSRVILNSRSFAPFEKSYKLGDSIDKEQITAEFVDGVLTVTLQKKEGKVNRTIDIR